MIWNALLQLKVTEKSEFIGHNSRIWENKLLTSNLMILLCIFECSSWNINLSENIKDSRCSLTTEVNWKIRVWCS